MPEARLTPQKWIEEINKAMEDRTVNVDLRNRWNLLKVARLHDGIWHKNVKEKIVIPYNILHGGWATRGTLNGKSVQQVSSYNAKGTPDLVKGQVMPGGFDNINASLSNHTKNVFKELWGSGGATGGRGVNTFGSGPTQVTLDHKRIGVGRSEDRLWYLPRPPFTAYYVSVDHIDSTGPGRRALGSLSSTIESFGAAQPVQVCYLHLDTTCSQLYVVS